MSMKKTFQEKATGFITAVAEKERNIWPPVCIGPCYQPPRPARPGQEQPPAEACKKARR